MSPTLRGGRRTGLSATAGVESGYLVHVVGAVVGISAVIAASAELFTAVKVVGAAWLLEYHLLVLGSAITLMIVGAGAWSVDGALEC